MENSRVLEPVPCIVCCSSGKSLQKAVIRQVYIGCWVESQLQRELCGPQLSKVASNPPRLDCFRNNAFCERCEPMTADPCSVSYQQDLPKFPFSVHYGCLSKQPWWITVCLLKPSRPLLKDVNPSVSSNFTQMVTACFDAFHYDFYPRDKWVWDAQESAVLCFLFLHLQGASLCVLGAWGRTHWKSREQASPCCCE